MIIGFSINKDTFIQEFLTLPGKDPTKLSLPDGVEENDFDLIMRLLKAEHMSELEDIDDDTLLELYNKLTLIFPLLANETIFTDNKCVEKLRILRTTKGARRHLI